MTGFSQPPDPDGDLPAADEPATGPMTPDLTPEHDGATPGFDEDHDPDALPRGQHGPTADFGDD